MTTAEEVKYNGMMAGYGRAGCSGSEVLDFIELVLYHSLCD